MDRWMVDVVNKRLVNNYIEAFRGEPGWPKDYALTVIEMPESKVRIATMELSDLKEFAESQGWSEESASQLTPPAGYRTILFVGMDDKTCLGLYNEAGLVAKAGAA